MTETETIYRVCVKNLETDNVRWFQLPMDGGVLAKQINEFCPLEQEYMIVDSENVPAGLSGYIFDINNQLNEVEMLSEKKILALFAYLDYGWSNFAECLKRINKGKYTSFILDMDNNNNNEHEALGFAWSEHIGLEAKLNNIIIPLPPDDAVDLSSFIDYQAIGRDLCLHGAFKVREISYNGKEYHVAISLWND